MSKPSLSNSIWVGLLERLPLSRTEQEVVKRFSADPDGRGFLPVADVFRAHKLFEESVELLSQGVTAHPQFAVARVVLAREYYQRGMLYDSWKLLQDSPVPLFDNVLAQKLLFKMALAFGDESTVAKSLATMTQLQGVDAEIKRLSDSFETFGIAVARDAWRQELSALGIRVESIPEQLDKRQFHATPSNADITLTNARPSKFLLEYDLDTETKKEFLQYHVVPLDEIFSVENAASSKDEAKKKGMIELDSTTLAEIYVKQGYYSKALGIYRRLLRLSPHNDLIRMKVSEVARLEKEQRSADLEADPLIFDKMEVVEIIDRQMRFYNGLLAKLN